MTIKTFFLLYPDLQQTDSSVESIHEALVQMNVYELTGLVIDSDLQMLDLVRDAVADYLIDQRTVN